MAEILKNYVFKKTPRGHSYPWHEWFDGTARRMKRGEDYTCSTRSFEQCVYKRAKMMGIRVHVSERTEVSLVVVAEQNGAPAKAKKGK